ncbi:MAG: hypothetical protein J0H67_03425 [Rhodospirillales bacterium]|nr:hypothetical protein [Rhodospirillales bacterium]
MRGRDLLLVAHGSDRWPEAGVPVETHAAALRQTGLFDRVAVALLAGGPPPATVLAGCVAPRVDVVPFFMEAGWFTTVAIPRALGCDGGAGTGRDIRISEPVGTHPALADLIVARVARLAPAARRLLLIGHGSARHPGRRLALHDHAERLASRFERVEVALLEEPPFVPDALAALRDAPVAVLGLFAGAGGHVREDLPALLATAAAAGAPLCDCGTIADEPGLRALILDRVGLPPPERAADA